MSRTRAGFLALAFLGWGSLAHALGLGEIEVRSRLNQPLSAVIPVSSTVPGELDGVIVELASNEEFERVGLERSEFLSSLRFQVQGNTIKVTSKQIAREPFVSFLLDVRWADGRLLREYTVLLDPPAMAPSASQRPAEAAKPAPQQPAATAAPAQPASPQPEATEAPAEAAAPQALPEAEAAPETETEAPAAPAPSRASGDTYGPVAPKETLWSIAYQLRPDASLTMDQMQVAIFNANPRAFHEGRLTGLMKGVTLAVPSDEEIRAVDPVAAKAQVAAARAGTAAAPAAPAARAEPAPVTEATPPAETAAAEPAPAEAPADETPAETPPAETPPVAEEAPAPSPAEAPAEAPIETTPAPVTQAPIIEEESGLLAQLRGLAENPLLVPAVAGIVVLLLLLLAGKWARNRYAQWSYQRALRRAPVAGSAAAAEASYEEEAPAEPPSTQSMLDEVAEAPLAHADETQTFNQPPLPQSRPSAAPQPIVETMQQTQAHEPALAQSGGKLDFDVTGNFSSETVQINLEAGDPVSEAEFHRAYGLYDEAALLLKQALQKDPKRTDARVKLAEIYFEASRQKEFVDVARELKGQLPAEEWQKIALLGTQIAPDDELFKGGAMDVGGAVDLSFDEPAAPAAAPKPAAAAPAAPAASSDSLDFKFEDIQLPDVPAAPAAPAAPAEGGLEFDLGSLSLDTPGTEPAAPAAPAAPSAPAMPAPGGDELSLDLGDFDLKTDAGTSAPAGGSESAELSLDLPMEEAPAAGGDEASTKLDLARAYIDMGDNDMAKSLLNEVAQQGNAEQQKEAQELLKRVPG